MQKIRRYSRNAQVITEVQGSYTPPQSAAAETFNQIRNGFDAGVKFMRPAVEQEQTARGEQEALEAVDKDSFEMRKPFTIRDAAFNQTAERVITNRTMIDLDDQMQAAMRKADGRISVLNAEMDRIRGEVGGGLPAINGLETAWTESFERGVSAARRQTTALAERRAIAAQRQAASDAASRVESEVERLALTAGNQDELAAALSAGQANLANYGPRGEFELNGVTYPADNSRSGILSTRQLGAMQDGLEQQAHEIFLQADYLRSDSPAQWAGEFRRSVLAGESPLPVSQSLTMLGRFESASRADEAARLREERAVETAMAESADRALAPFGVAAENGVYVAIPDETRQQALDAVAGNSRLSALVRNQLAAADAVVELQGVPFNQQGAFIERAFAEFAAVDGINEQEATLINALAPHLKATRAAIDRETVGIPAAEALVSSGNLVTPADLAQMRTNAGGNAEVIQSINVLEESLDIIDRTEGMSGLEREELLNNLDVELSKLAIQGESVGASAQIRLQGLALAQEHYAAIADAANDDVSKFAQLQGIPLAPLVNEETGGLGDVANNLIARVAAIKPATQPYGNETPVPLSSSEIEQLSDLMLESNNSQRVAFMSTILGTGEAQSSAILEAIGVDNPPLLAAARVANSNQSASRTILAGMQVKLPVPPATVREAEIEISSVLLAGDLDDDTLAGVRTTAEAYARGIAAREGGTEISLVALQKGYDIALGADEDGNGGIETVTKRGAGDYGTTILPTGVNGDAVGRMLDDGLTAANLAAFAGGTVLDGMGRYVPAAGLRQTIAGFRVIANEEGLSMLVPTTADGSLFMVRGEDGAMGVFSFDPRGE